MPGNVQAPSGAIPELIMQKWEYQLHRLAGRPREDTLDLVVASLNTMGDDGWEIVGVWPDGLHILLKRPKKAA